MKMLFLTLWQHLHLFSCTPLRPLLNWGIICCWSLLSYYGPHPITGRLWCTFAVAICWLPPQTFLRNCLASIWRLPFSLDSFWSFPYPMQYLLARYTISHTLISFHLYLPTSDTVSQLLSCFNFNHVFTYPSNNPFVILENATPHVYVWADSPWPTPSWFLGSTTYQWAFFFITMMTVLKSFCTILSIKIKEWITVFSSLRAYQDRVMMTQFAHCHFKICIDELQ